MFVVGLLLAAGQPSTVIPDLSDEQLCQSLQRTYAKVVGSRNGPATILQSGPDCRAKVLNNRLAVELSGPQRERYVSAFMGAANTNLCHSTAPTIVAFRARHWRWDYEFRFTDGSVIRKQIAC